MFSSAVFWSDRLAVAFVSWLAPAQICRQTLRIEPVSRRALPEDLNYLAIGHFAEGPRLEILSWTTR